MAGVKRGLILVGLLLFVLAAAAPAAANHWCGQTSVSVAPSNPVVGRATTFTITVTNTGIDTTQVSAVQAKFSWEGTWHTMGGGTILAGNNQAFTTTATAPSAGAYTVEVKVTGTSSGDVLHESSDCSSTVNLTAAQASPGLDAAMVMIAIVGVGVFAAESRRRRRL